MRPRRQTTPSFTDPIDPEVILPRHGNDLYDHSDDAVLLVDAQVFPQTLAVVRTRATALGLPVVVADLTAVTDADGLRAAAGGGAAYGVVVQYPDAAGEVRDWRALTAAAHDAGALVTAIADLLALTLLAPPGEWGADIAVGTTQRFGVPMMFGGPHAASNTSAARRPPPTSAPRKFSSP